jgi:hypothetical protein
MVNIVIRHGSQLQGHPMLRNRPPAVIQRYSSPKLLNQLRRKSSRSIFSPLELAASGPLSETRNPVSSHYSSDSPSRNHFATEDIEADRECDYDKNVTKLYECLESSDWKCAIERCRVAKEEARTWILRQDGIIIRWKLLPLHAAIIFQAPEDMIKTLIQSYPLACQSTDDQGMLPLHLGMRHQQKEKILLLLLQHYPSGVKFKDKRDKLPIDHSKERIFTGTFLRLYAEAASSSHNQFQKFVDEAGKSSLHHGSCMASVEDYYEKRIEDLRTNHEKAMYRLRVQAEQEHEKEIEELKDLVSKKIVSTHRSSKVEEEVEELETSLAHSNNESRALRVLLSKQRQYQNQLKDKFRIVIRNQKALHALCTQQKDQLEEAEKIRKQLVRSLLQKEEDEVSTDICERSSKILESTEAIWSEIISSDQEKECDLQETTRLIRQVGHSEEADNATPLYIRERGNDEWGGQLGEEYDDTVSAITDNFNS